MHGLYKQNNLPYLSVKLCPNCKKLVPVKDDVCQHCNYNFTSKISAKDLFVEDEKPIEPINGKTKTIFEQPEHKQPVNKPILNSKVVFCDNCGAKIIGSQKYCGGCGAKVSKRICPSCEQIIDSNLAFCPLCGEKMNDPIPQQPVKTIVEEPVKQTSNVYSGQPINIYLNQNDKPTTVIPNPAVSQQAQEELTEVIKTVELNNDDPVTLQQEEEQQQPSYEEVSQISPEELNEESSDEEEVTPLKEIINMGRKRLFIIMQLIVVAVIAAVMVVVPVLTKEFFITEMINCFKGTSNESLITFKDLIYYFKDTVNYQIFDVKPSVIRPLLSSEEGKLIFTDITFLNPIFKKIPVEDQNYFLLQLSYCSMLTTYGLIVLSAIIVFFSSLFGLFIRKPMKGKAIGFTTLMLFICAAVVYALNTYFNGFKDYDSWLVYAFLLSFVMWMLIKLVFLKENRRYKKAKEALADAYIDDEEDDEDYE